MSVCVISVHGERLMPTNRLGKVRHLLKNNKAKIINRHPFTIQLLYDTHTYTQPIELCIDTGYQHIGLSVKSEIKEYFSRQYDLLPDEKSRHDDARKYRRTRRNRLRYRKPRFNNRKKTKPEGWLAPSIRNKANVHIDLIHRFVNVLPVTAIILELGQFDTQLLQAIQEGKPIPEGTDYQHGQQYAIATLREAVLQRDGYKCVFCGRGLKDNAILHIHHAYYWKGRHGDRLDELTTACELCHTAANHQQGGKLYGYDKKMRAFTGAAFMNTVRWYIYQAVKGTVSCQIKITYGAQTKLTRNALKIDKSHVNDAYCMGEFRPADRAGEQHYQKRRRNNRILEKFYDAKHIDIRDGKVKSGAQLSCNRTNRREPRVSEKSLRTYRGQKVSKGRRSIRRQRYTLQPGDIVQFNGQRYKVKGVQNKGTYVAVEGKTPIAMKKVTTIRHINSWVELPA
ncbi:MAG: HNH endonuclease [Peptococcaceae bacterium]|nr:HNH endonuclease [Peptococcaceae bacterium]